MENERNLREILNRKLLSQSFGSMSESQPDIEAARAIAQLYSRLENCISVLTDMKARRSYVYYGALAEQIKLKNKPTEIDSIWEEELFGHFHAEDLRRKFRLELQFFQMLSTMDPTVRADYELITKLRVSDNGEKQVLIEHRLLYISSFSDGSAWLALCLYNKIPDHSGFHIPDGVIINHKTGTVEALEAENSINVLSLREIQVLQLIKLGYKSKFIADKLSISMNTVNRHRQNILEKLNAVNAIEACRMAEKAGLLL